MSIVPPGLPTLCGPRAVSRVVTLVLALSASPLASCGGEARADERIELPLAALPPSAGVNEAGIWQSVGWPTDSKPDGGEPDPWHRYPGGSQLVVEHDLGRAPRSVLVYLSFEPDGRAAGLATGDLAHVLSVSADSITIRNNTKADFYCRIVLQ